MDILRDQIEGFALESGVADDAAVRRESLPADVDGDQGLDMPPQIGTDERRMQVRAYNYWASLLGERSFPSIDDLEPDQISDFGPYSVLLDFTTGIENPAIAYLGSELAAETGGEGELAYLDDVPSRSLLSRITDHYMQILANQAPIGFEAEFVNDRDRTILYRGILLPFSSDDDSIDFIYGVINWKELADQRTTDALLLEIDQAIEAQGARIARDAIWPDSAAALADPVPHDDFAEDEEDVLDLAGLADAEALDGEPAEKSLGASAPYRHDALIDTPVDLDGLDDPVVELPVVNPVDYDVDWSFATPELPLPSFDAIGDDSVQGASDIRPLASLDSGAIRPSAKASLWLDGSDEDAGVSADGVAGVEQTAADEAPPVDGDLYDWLAHARSAAELADESEDRSRQSLYVAIGRAYDFALLAEANPAQRDAILQDAGLTVQPRAPYTPLVKLVFGVQYDKTRLTEYAAVLSYGRRIGVPPGALADHIAGQPGGIKALVREERKLRKAEQGEAVPATLDPVAVLRSLPDIAPEDIDFAGEFAMLVARRNADGTISLIGAMPADTAQIAKAAARLKG